MCQRSNMFFPASHCSIFIYMKMQFVTQNVILVGPCNRISTRVVDLFLSGYRLAFGALPLLVCSSSLSRVSENLDAWFVFWMLCHKIWSQSTSY
uniref:Uncharacterized protein n=1 Tax=Triticum urartu TaxID=4572 RepID=A0A8R7VEC6_TRIUA